MGWGIPASGSSEKPPAGNHAAVCVAVIDMGHQWQEPFNKDEDKGYWSWRAFFVWELVNEQIAATKKNHVIGIDLTLSVKDTAKLYKWVLARTGKAPGVGFDPTSELGQPCMLSVIEKNKYPKVDGMAALPKGMPPPAPTYTPVAVSLDEFRAGAVLPEWVPWLYGSPLEDHIKACREIGGAKPAPRKGAPQQTGGGAPTDGAPGDTPPGGPDPTAKWDYHDGGKWVKGATTADVATHIHGNKLDPAAVWVKPAGADAKAAGKKAAEFGFTADPIPW
jgi:hypothetical protein